MVGFGGVAVVVGFVVVVGTGRICVLVAVIIVSVSCLSIRVNKLSVLVIKTSEVLTFSVVGFAVVDAFLVDDVVIAGRICVRVAPIMVSMSCLSIKVKVPAVLVKKMSDVSTLGLWGGGGGGGQ